MDKKVKVYFLGSGKIAVPVLNRLVWSDRIELLGIGTQLDRPAGRKKKLHPTPIGEFAHASGLQADKIPAVNADDFLDYLRWLAPDFIVVASFGQILKQPLLELPEISCVNVHASLLPRYRGASPIAAAIVNHDASAGVCFMEMDRGLDTGRVYCSFEHLLSGNERADWLEEALGRLAADKIVGVLEGIAKEKNVPVAQDDKHAVITKKIHKSDGIINWNLPAAEIESRIRGYYPWPGAAFALRAHNRKITVRVTSASVHALMSGKPGEVLQADKKGWIIACGANALELLTIVPQDKNEMRGIDFLNGCHLDKGIIVGME
ncbi:MAG: methionyl-tRNA formyltransferase [Victivallaceae bacterium]|jgi:methionyl-tRNA formyltransferase